MEREEIIVEKARRRVKKKKKGTNLFVKYFSISATTVFLSFLCIASIMVFFIAGQWWTDKVDALSRNADDIVEICTDLKVNDKHDEELITTTLQIMSKSTVSDYFITDITLQWIDDKNRKMIGYQCSESCTDFAAFENKRCRDRKTKLKAERNQTTVKHSDRPSAGNILRCRFFGNHLCI